MFVNAWKSDRSSFEVHSHSHVVEVLAKVQAIDREKTEDMSFNLPAGRQGTCKEINNMLLNHFIMKSLKMKHYDKKNINCN